MNSQYATGTFGKIKEKNMFTYYLSSLHELREKNLELNRATTHAWLEVMAHVIDGQYLVGRAILHPAAHQLGSHHPGAHWEMGSNSDHQELVMKWLNEGVAKTAKAQELIFAAFTHHATGWGELGHELVRKLQKDAGPEFTAALKMIDQTMHDVVSAESSVLESARQVAKSPSVVVKAPAVKTFANTSAKPATKRAARARKAS